VRKIFAGYTSDKELIITVNEQMNRAEIFSKEEIRIAKETHE
jgi:hypothetical protein